MIFRNTLQFSYLDTGIYIQYNETNGRPQEHKIGGKHRAIFLPFLSPKG